MARPGSPRLDPNAAIDALQDGLARLVDQYWPTRPPRWAPPAAWDPAIDVFETPEAYILLADLPGVAASAIDLTIDGLVLTLRGERADADPGRVAGTAPDLPRERRTGPFQRRFALESPVEAEAIQAELRDGVLHVSLPKALASRTRTIPVQPS